MSFQEGGNLAPYISTCSPDSFSDAGVVSVQIDGVNFSPNMKVGCDTSLGTISNVVVSQPTATSSRVIFDINVSSPPTGFATRSITLSNGGVSDTNSSVSVVHGFTVAGLFNSTGTDGVYFDASDASKMQFHDSANQTGLLQWDTSAGISVSLLESKTNYGKLAAWPTESTKTGFTKSTYGLEHWTGNTTEAIPGAGGSGGPFTLAAVLYIDSSILSATGYRSRIIIGINASYGLGYADGSFYSSNYDDFPGINSNLSASAPVTQVGTYAILTTSDGSNNYLYVNGSLAATKPSTSAGYVGGTIAVDNEHSVYSNSRIGDIFGITRVLTSQEITNLSSFLLDKYT